MSNATKRQEIADALTASGVVKGYAFRPSAPKPGDAWAQLGTTATQSAYVLEDNWLIFIWLPQNERGADKWRDEHQQTIAVALYESGTAYVDEFIPVNLGNDTNPVFGLQLNLRSN